MNKNKNISDNIFIDNIPTHLEAFITIVTMF